jgi:hypothetical protein
MAWILAFVIVITVAGILWRRGLGGRYVKGAFIAAFFIPVFIVPAMAAESISMGPDALEVGSRFWLSPPVCRVELRSLVRVTPLKKAVPQRFLSREDTFWEFTYLDGHTEVLHLSDLFEANQRVVMAALQRRGVRIDSAP